MKKQLVLYIVILFGCEESMKSKAEKMRERLENREPASAFELCILDAYHEFSTGYDELLKYQINQTVQDMENKKNNSEFSLEQREQENRKKLEKEIAYREYKRKIDEKYCRKEAECVSDRPDVYENCIDYGPFWSYVRWM